MSGRHTPGPWLVQVEQDGELVVWTRQSHIGTLATVHSEDINGLWPVEANACLIAAAPELLAAVEAFLHYDANDEADGVQMMLGYDTALALAREALAKALGTTCNQSREAR